MSCEHTTVAACRYDISGWYCIPGAIATWNLVRLGSSSSDSSGRPDRLVDVDACVMCCAFHPAEPVGARNQGCSSCLVLGALCGCDTREVQEAVCSCCRMNQQLRAGREVVHRSLQPPQLLCCHGMQALLAGGTFNGELIIWDLSRDDANAQVRRCHACMTNRCDSCVTNRSTDCLTAYSSTACRRQRPADHGPAAPNAAAGSDSHHTADVPTVRRGPGSVAVLACRSARRLCSTGSGTSCCDATCRTAFPLPEYRSTVALPPPFHPPPTHTHCDTCRLQVGKTDVLSELRHSEPITALSWQYSGQEARRHGAAAAAYRLFTLGADGRLLVWLWDQLSNPVYG